MATITTSPNDPVFFLHHSMIDRIWASLQTRHVRVTPADIADIRKLGYRHASLIADPRISTAAGSAAGLYCRIARLGCS